MKNKISVFALLLSLILALFVPVSASAATETTADDVKYSNVEEFMHEMGYTDFVQVDDAYHFVCMNDRFLYVFCFTGISNNYPYFAYLPNTSDYREIVVMCNKDINTFNFYRYNAPSYAASSNDFSLQESNSNSYMVKLTYMNNSVWAVFPHYGIYPSKLENLIYSDLDIYSHSDSPSVIVPGSGELLFESTKSSDYDFKRWCVDAGLNCLASSNESPLKIPYSYNSYWHIVRKTSNGKWLLTTIGNSVMQENIADYRLLVGENGNLHVASIYSGDDVNGYKINVRQYEYDTDGWKVRTYETLDTRDSSGIVDLGAGSGFDDTRVLAYTSESIYDHNGSLPLYEKSTEYFDVTNTPDKPDEPDSPTPIPTTTPGSGSGSSGGGVGGGTRPESPDIGGDVDSGGGLDFIISLFTKIWTDICSVKMSVDGYSISLQQIFVYGALVSIIGGFIMHFIFGRR